jgi:hypothetical protein
MVKTRLHDLVEVAVSARLTPKETDAAVEEGWSNYKSKSEK